MQISKNVQLDYERVNPKILWKYSLITSVLDYTLQTYWLPPKNSPTKEYHPRTSKSLALPIK